MFRQPGKLIRTLLSVLVLLTVGPKVSAQYYSWGNDQPSLKWNHLKQG